MNPLGALVGAGLGLLIILAATLVPPIVMLHSKRVSGRERLVWFSLAIAPSLVYWTNTYKGMPFTVVFAGILLSPAVLVAFWAIKRKAEGCR